MHRLPDGSGFFIAEFGERDPGLVNRLKYHRKGYARQWLRVWRNYRSGYEISRWPDQGPPMSHWRAFRYALSVS